jgi:hypothetical protein
MGGLLSDMAPQCQLLTLLPKTNLVFNPKGNGIELASQGWKRDYGINGNNGTDGKKLRKTP